MEFKSIGETEVVSFKEIETAEELVDFLGQQAAKHEFLYHYTTLGNFKKILKGHAWRLRNACDMNDLHEYQVKFDKAEVWKNIFSACFSFGDEDNLAMWSMYGIPWEDAIRIRFSQKSMQDWIASIKTIKCENDKKEQEIMDFPRKSISLHDICYFRGYIGSAHVLTNCPNREIQYPVKCPVCPPQRLLWDLKENFNLGCITTCGSYLVEDVVGFVKNSAWEYEKETRLVFTLPQSSKDIKYIYIPIGEEILSQLQISLGPFCNLNIDKVASELKELNGNIFSQIHVDASYFRGKACRPKLQRHCDVCRPDFACARCACCSACY